MNSKKENRILILCLTFMVVFVAGIGIVFGGGSGGQMPAVPSTHLSVIPAQAFVPPPTHAPFKRHHVVRNHKKKHKKLPTKLPTVFFVTPHRSRPVCLSSVHAGAIHVQLVSFRTADDPTSTTSDPTTTDPPTTEAPTTTTDPPTTTTTTQPFVPPVTVTLPPIFHPPTTTTGVPVKKPPIKTGGGTTTATTTPVVIHHRVTKVPPPPSPTAPTRRACR